MILSHLSLKEKACSRRVNRNWYANTIFTTSELNSLLEYVVHHNRPSLEWLLKDPRVDSYLKDNGEILIAACITGHSAVVERILKDFRRNGGSIYIALALASDNGHLDIVEQLLPLVDASRAKYDISRAVLYAHSSGHFAVVDRLLKDPRVVKRYTTDPERQ